ncbi:hypothetical protein NBRC116494_37690 [Aurantivibrio plasticivorans]
MISIRELVLSDLESMIELFTDERVFANFDKGPWSKSRIEESVLRNVSIWYSGQIGSHVICKENRVIGKLIVFPNKDNEHELGFVLHPSYWGKGYATVAGELGINYLEFNTEVDHVVAFARKSNVASIRVIQKLGFLQCDERTGADGITRFKYIRSLASKRT